MNGVRWNVWIGVFGYWLHFGRDLHDDPGPRTFRSRFVLHLCCSIWRNRSRRANNFAYRYFYRLRQRCLSVCLSSVSH